MGDPLESLLEDLLKVQGNHIPLYKRKKKKKYRLFEKKMRVRGGPRSVKTRCAKRTSFDVVEGVREVAILPQLPPPL